MASTVTASDFDASSLDGGEGGTLDAFSPHQNGTGTIVLPAQRTHPSGQVEAQIKASIESFLLSLPLGEVRDPLRWLACASA